MCEWGNTKTIQINGEVVGVDSCIANLIQELNGLGYKTVASCCGHGVRPGVISFADGGQFLLIDSFSELEKINELINTKYPPISMEHIESEECWCEPEIEECDGSRIIIHRDRH
jgi:hypothetical protein